jgi:hypothetical protein
MMAEARWRWRAGDQDGGGIRRPSFDRCAGFVHPLSPLRLLIIVPSETRYLSSTRYLGVHGEDP